jgi:hypothetical protein
VLIIELWSGKMKYGVNLFFKGELIRTCKGTKKQMNKIKNKWLLKTMDQLLRK